MTGRLPRALKPLAHRDFRLLWIGQTVSGVGNSIHLVAVPFQILALGGTAVQIGIWFALITLVRSLFLLLAGALLDRTARRGVVLACDLTNGVMTTALGLLGLAAIIRMEHLYIASIVLGVTTSFSIPAMRAIVPEFLPADLLVQGNALRGISRQIGRISGPAIGGILVAAFGPPVGFLADAATYFTSFAALSFTRLVKPAPPPRRHLLIEVNEGLSYVASVTWLRIFILSFAVVNVGLFAPMIVGLPILVRDVMDTDARAFGAISAALGVGQFLGGVLVGQLVIHRIGAGHFVLVATASLTVTAFGLAPTMPLVLLFAAGNGLALVMANAFWETAMQQNVPRHLLGRVASIDELGSIALAPIAPIVAGGLIEAHGAAPIFIAGGALATSVALAALASPSVRALSLRTEGER